MIAIELICPRFDWEGRMVSFESKGRFESIASQESFRRIGTFAGIISRTCLTRLINDI